MSDPVESDLVVIGGGVIGLSVAYEMCRRGATVTVLSRGELPGRASWAGGGVLLPTNRETAIHPLEQLRALSSRLHRQWATQLKSETGIDNGFCECGGVYFARSPGEIASLAGQTLRWSEDGIENEWIDDDRLSKLIPGLSNQYTDNGCKSAWVPGEWQIRNPDHLTALTAAITSAGGNVNANVESVEVQHSGDRVTGVKIKTLAAKSGVEEQSIRGKHYLLAAGAWSGQIVQPLGIRLPMVPVRGQMLLFRLPEQQFSPVLYEGNTYLIPRSDGHVLVGSTLEEAGFDPVTTQSAVASLRRFAVGAIPALNEKTFVRAWAGLRPGTNDGFPYLGRLTPYENFFAATGHFRWGLHLSTGTAVVMADLIEGRAPEIPLDCFDPVRMDISA